MIIVPHVISYIIMFDEATNISNLDKQFYVSGELAIYFDDIHEDLYLGLLIKNCNQRHSTTKLMNVTW